MITPPRLEYYGDIPKAQALKGAALQFFSFCCLGIGEVLTITRTDNPMDGVVFQATVNKDPYGNLFGVIRIFVELIPVKPKNLIYITYPDRTSNYLPTDWLRFRKQDRLEYKKAFETPVFVNYFAGGTLNQSLSEVSSPNKSCVGGYWINKDFTDCISFTRDTIYYDGKYKRISWIESDTDYAILAASISGKKIFIITGKIYSGWFTTKHAYSSCAYDSVSLWVYEIGEPVDYEMTLTELHYASVMTTGRTFSDEIMAGFFLNSLNFYLYHRNFAVSAEKRLISYSIDADDYSISSNVLYSTDDFDLATGIDNIFRDVISITTAGNCELKKLKENTLISVSTDISDNGNIYMFMFADTAKDVFIYTKNTSSDGYNKLWFKGAIYDIDDLPITNYLSIDGGYPNMYNDWFTYAYNNKVIICCFKLFTLIINCDKSEFEYEKYNYRFDAFNTSTGAANINYTPLSVIKAGTK